MSRRGRIGSSDGIENGRSPIETSSALRFSSSIAHRDLVSRPAAPDAMLSNNVGKRRWGEMGSATGEALWETPDALHVEEQRAGAAPGCQLPLPLLGDFPCLLAVLAADGEG